MKVVNLTGFTVYIYIYIYRFQNVFYVVRPLDSIAFYLPTGLHLSFFRSWPSLFLPSSFSSVFLLLSFVLSSTSMLLLAVIVLPFFEHGRTMSAGIGINPHILISLLDGGEWSTSRSSHFNPRKKSWHPRIWRLRGQNLSDYSGEEENFLSLPGFEPIDHRAGSLTVTTPLQWLP